jgi:AbrB family looped-hinge helix DNA binding protein
MTVTVSSKGQMVLPSQIRKRYNIGPQTKVEVLDTGDEIVIVPLPQNTFRASRGILKGVTSDDVIAARRKERKYEHTR